MRARTPGALVAIAALLLVPHLPNATAAVTSAQSAASTTIAVTHNNNLLFVTVDGSLSRQITLGGAADGLLYPWYQWSPDGKYLLLTRAQASHTGYDLLVLGANGAQVRTVATNLPTGGLQPAWATDSDQIAYLAAASSANAPQPVRALNLQTGVTRTLFTYTRQGNCGGGTSDPAEQLLWGETGFNQVAPTFQWNVSSHTALYGYGCGGGLTLVDLWTGQGKQIGSLNASGRIWIDGTLSSSGKLAAAVFPAGSSAQSIITIAAPDGSGAHAVRAGILPSWSPDGQELYFEQRVPIKPLAAPAASFNSEAYTSEIWQVNADGSHLTRLASLDAYALGPLQVASDNSALVFTRIDNDSNLQRTLLSSHATQVTPALLQQFGPQTTVDELTIPGGRLSTVTLRATHPEIQPFVPSLPAGPTLSTTQTTSYTATSSVTTTKVVFYTPTISTGTAISGSCSAHSIAVSRANAWHCASGKQVFDPCFSAGLSLNPTSVICVASPFGTGQSQTLTLTRPLPLNLPFPTGYHAWAFVLQSGVDCTFLQGAALAFNGNSLDYSCADGSYILGEAHQGEVWTVTNVKLSANRQAISGQQTISLQAVWI